MSKLNNNEILEILENKFSDKFVDEFKILVNDDAKIKKVGIIPENNRWTGFGFWVRCDVKDDKTHLADKVQHRFKHVVFSDYKMNNVDYQKVYKVYKEMCNKDNAFVVYGDDRIEPHYGMTVKITEYLKHKKEEFANERQLFPSSPIHDLKKYLFKDKFLGSINDNEDEIFESNEVLFNKVRKVMGNEITKLAKSHKNPTFFKINEICFIPQNIENKNDGYIKDIVYDFSFDIGYSYDVLKNSYLKKLGVDQLHDYACGFDLDSKNKNKQKEYKTFLMNKGIKFKISDKFKISKELVDDKEYINNIENQIKEETKEIARLEKEHNVGKKVENNWMER